MKRLNIGMPIENALWLTGTETEQHLDRWRRDCEAELGRFALENGVLLAPATWTEKLPGEDRVPPVPDHISGPNVRLLVCEAIVTGEARPVVVKSTGFVHDLDKRDLARLREITRGAAGAQRSDAECDEIIEEIGPESALKTLRGAVDAGGMRGH